MYGLDCPLNPTLSDEKIVTCTLCELSEEGCTLVCGHQFGIPCLEAYIRAEFNDNLLKIKCPHQDCKMLIPISTLKKILKNESEILDKNLWESYLKAQGYYIYHCPLPQCQTPIIKTSLKDIRNNKMYCKCGFSFCLNCK